MTLLDNSSYLALNYNIPKSKKIESEKTDLETNDIAAVGDLDLGLPSPEPKSEELEKLLPEEKFKPSDVKENWMENTEALDPDKVIKDLITGTFPSFNISIKDREKPDSKTTSVDDIVKYHSQLKHARKAVDERWKEIDTGENTNILDRTNAFKASIVLGELETRFAEQLKDYQSKLNLNEEDQAKLNNLDAEVKSAEDVKADKIMDKARISTDPADWQNVFAANLNTGNAARVELTRKDYLKIKQIISLCIIKIMLK